MNSFPVLTTRHRRQRITAMVTATLLMLSAQAVQGPPAGAAEAEFSSAPTGEPTETTDVASQSFAIITSRERAPTDPCGEPDVVSLEVYNPDTGLSDIVVTNETDCTAGVSRVRTSPDRSMITYQRPGPSTSILELTTGAVVRSINDCGSAEWNPDGSLLACRESVGSVKIVVVETGRNVNSIDLPDDSPVDAFDWVGPTELLATSNGAGSPCVVPSNLGPRRSALWRIEIAEPAFTRLVDSPCDVPFGELQVSAGADAISFVSAGDLYVAAIDGSSPARVALDDNGNQYGKVRAATWTTSGNQLIAITETMAPPGTGIATRLELIDAASGNRSAVATFARNLVFVGDAVSALGDGDGSVFEETPADSAADPGQGAPDVDPAPNVGVLGSTDVLVGSPDVVVGSVVGETPDDPTETQTDPDVVTDANPAPSPDPDPGNTGGTEPDQPADPDPNDAGGSDANPVPSPEPGNTGGAEPDQPADPDPTDAGDPGPDPDSPTDAADPPTDDQDSPVLVATTDGIPITILATSTEPVVVNVVGDDPSDQEAPTLTFTGVKASYAADETLKIECVVVDSGSGVDTTTCDSLTGKSYLFRGTNTLVGKATDLAGNSTEVTLIVTIDITAAELASTLANAVSETPEVNVVLAPLVGQLAAGNCGQSFQTFGARTREFAAEGTISAAASIQIYSLGIAVCRG